MRAARLLVLRLLRALGNAVISFGVLWVHIPPPPAVRALTGPPPLHPERLRPEIPLSEVELALQRQLAA